MRMIRATVTMFVTLALVWIVSGIASAQATSGTVAGSVRDAQGGRIPGVTVVLQSESRGTRLAPVITNADGDFVVPNVTPDTYTVEVSLTGFKTLQRKAVPVSGGDRVALGELALEVGGMAETVNVTSAAALIQAQSGERSFTVTTTEVQNLPLSNRNFATLTQLTPGVSGTARIGGGGQNNITMDGISVMDTGSNAQMLQLNVDAIGEVKVLTSNYQAEYGRSSGLQIMAVTKSGTNRFHGSLYDIMRNSDWNTNSWANQRNGVAKAVSKDQDWGYSVGGPAGRPSADNKLFFFYSHEFRPRSTGGNLARFKVPTELERRGDFSQTRDNQGAVFNLIRDYTTGLPCTAANNAGCFRADNVLGRIPANRLYAPGMAILNNLWPLPNVAQTPGLNYNLEVAAPQRDILSLHQVALRGDYQLSPSLRATVKFNGQDSSPGRPVSPGSVPGYNDTQRTPGTTWVSTWASTVAYTVNPTTFIEATYGQARNYLTAIPITEYSNINNTGLASLPMLYPDARILPEETFGYSTLSESGAPWFKDGKIWLPPNFVWGQRIGCTPSIQGAGGVAAPCPPNLNYPGAVNTNLSRDFSASVTRVAGRHTMKAGYYHNFSYKAQNINVGLGALPFQSEMNFGNDPNNPLDTGFGYANAALGILSTYTQQSKFVEGNYVYNNREFYAQDNWKVNNRLTLDFGLRFVNQQPQYDKYLNSSNFFMDRWSISNAPLLFVPACPAGAAAPCPTTRQAMNPSTRQLLGPGSAIYIGQLVPNTGDPIQGLVQAGQGISRYAYTWPTISVAPRFGAAYDLSGDQSMVLRGGVGWFFDRPDGNTVQNMVSNPPHSRGSSIRALLLSDLANAAAGPTPAAQVFSFRDDDGLPTSVQWNVGVQTRLPWSSSIDVSYVGQHAYNQLFGTGFSAAGVNINSIDIGAAFQLANQDPTLAASATPGASAVVADLLRPLRGYGVVNQQLGMFWRTYHSIQTAYQRRFSRGISAGLNWTLSLVNNGTPGLIPRLQHNADGTYALRDDWDEYVDLNKDQGVTRHVIKGNFVWDLPDLAASGGVLRQVAAAVANDWQVSGILSADSGSPYTVGFSYQSGGTNVNLTGSPDYPATVRILGDTGSGCSDDQYRQFNTGAFAGPVTPSVGLESGRNYMTGCPQQILDLAVARTFRLGGGRTAQVRVEAFNAFNTVAYSARSASAQFRSQTDQTVVNNQYNADGTLNESRLLPNSAGFGAVTGAQALRTVQAQFRFSF